MSMLSNISKGGEGHVVDAKGEEVKMCVSMCVV